MDVIIALDAQQVQRILVDHVYKSLLMAKRARDVVTVDFTLDGGSIASPAAVVTIRKPEPGEESVELHG